MGADACQLIIDAEEAAVTCLAGEPVFVGQAGSSNLEHRVERSADDRFLIVSGTF